MSTTLEREAANCENLHDKRPTRYPLVDLLSIQIVERPDDEDVKQIFYNPRSLESFTPHEMDELKTSIRNNGLQTPLIVRVTTDDKTKTGKVVLTELIAGERRIRALRSLYSENALCYSDEFDKEVPAKELYAQVPCKIHYNISDEKALGLAYLENKVRKDLSLKEEIHLVERLIASGRTVKEVADILETNITLVSQLSNFRNQLPKQAFAKLLDGQLSKHVAVKILSYKPEDRQALYEASVEAEEETYQEINKNLQNKLEELEDLQDMHDTSAKMALLDENEDDVKRHEKKKAATEKQASIIKEKIKKHKQEKGTIRQSSLYQGAQKINVTPKKGVILPRLDIHQFYVKLPTNWLRSGKVDPVSGKAVPPDILEVIAETTKSILGGETDPMNVVHRIMVARGQWEAEEDMNLEPPVFDADREEAAEQVFDEDLE